jgi:subtilase family serine protease
MSGIVRRGSLGRQSRRLAVETLEPRAMLAAGPLGKLVGPHVVAVPTGTATESGPITTPNSQLMTPAVMVGQLPLPTTKGSYSPAQVRQAYGFDKLALNGAGQTIAIIDAYDDPTLWQDLQTFDQWFGLPDPNLTIAKQWADGKPPAFNSNWGSEIALDVEWAHAIAPKANILLCEANNAGSDDLFAMVDFARSYPGVSVVSMSWGGGSLPDGTLTRSSQTDFDYHFTTPKGHAPVTFVASTGDKGYLNYAQYPAASPNVLAVGGTSLTTYVHSNTLLSGPVKPNPVPIKPAGPATNFAVSYDFETGWAGSGGGISSEEPKPAYQGGTVYSMRTVPDVAYDADYNLWVYDSNLLGWFNGGGGTSAAAPQWAALIALANQGRAQLGQAPLAHAIADLYQVPYSDYHDITSGNNGFYNAAPGYDLVTGNGTPVANLLVPDLIRMEAGALRVAPVSITTLWTAGAVATTSSTTTASGAKLVNMKITLKTNTIAPSQAIMTAAMSRFVAHRRAASLRTLDAADGLVDVLLGDRRI